MNGFQKKFFVNYHTFLHKSLATPVFMRSLTMYDGTEIIHESYTTYMANLENVPCHEGYGC